MFFKNEILYLGVALFNFYEENKEVPYVKFANAPYLLLNLINLLNKLPSPVYENVYANNLCMAIICKKYYIRFTVVYRNN